MVGMLVLLLVFALGVLPVQVEAQSEPVEEAFDEGNAFFKERQYDSAIARYQQVLQSGRESASVHFNLGNAYFRDGDIGRAMVSYLRAQRLDPTDDDIAANLEFVRKYTTVQMEGVRLNPISTFFESLVAPYRLSTLAWVSSIFFILFFGLLTVRYGLANRSSLVRTGVVLSLILLLVSSLLTTVKYDRDYLTRHGVIVAEECVVRTGPSLESDKELDASPGLVVEILDESGDWYNVLFENKRRGWVRKDLVSVV
jgi:tetratricopeptide (TPR) repeat protein